MDKVAFAMEWMERLDWPADQIEAERRKDLRGLISFAKENSPFYAKRLRDINPETVTETDLAIIPPLTKIELMDNWDQIVTVPGLTLEKCESHIPNITEDSFLLYDHHVIATGGTTGQPGIVVHSEEEWQIYFFGSMIRWILKWVISNGKLETILKNRPFGANIMSASLLHPTSLASNDPDFFITLNITMPLHDIVSTLNEFQPLSISSYPSMMRVLAEEAIAGRLKINPILAVTTAEPLLPEIKETFKNAWKDIVIFDNYGAGEVGTIAVSCGNEKGMYLNDDVSIIEIADEDGTPSCLCKPGSKVYVTPLKKYSMPMIRYELSDEVTLLNGRDTKKSAFSRIDHILGRKDDIFYYSDGLIVHPNLFRSALIQFSAINSYQVRQTEQGADILITSTKPVDCEKFKQIVEKGLSRIGLNEPCINVSLVKTIERTGHSNKLKRFIPL